MSINEKAMSKVLEGLVDPWHKTFARDAIGFYEAAKETHQPDGLTEHIAKQLYILEWENVNDPPEWEGEKAYWIDVVTKILASAPRRESSGFDTPFKYGDTHCEDCPCRYGQHLKGATG